MNKEIVERLFERRSYGIKPGLEATEKLLEELGNPHDNIRIVHIAGTNGKGSVSAIIASVLKNCGVKAGLYTSPHLLRLNERFRINDEEIDDGELYPLLEKVEQAANDVEKKSNLQPTFFECMTALALLWFSHRNIHLAVVETGMGGRLDATNVISPLISVITRIGVDHTMYLGNALKEIALEKAGIIKSGIPVVCAVMPDEALEVVAKAASERNAHIRNVSDTVSVQRVSGSVREQKVRVSSSYQDYGTILMKLAASYQVENVATAVAAIEALGDVLGVSFSKECVAKGLSEAEWAGRFQCIDGEPDVIIDGAHNSDGAQALVKALRDAGCGNKIRFVVAQSSDKEKEGFFRTIAPLCSRLWTVPMKNPRMEKPAVLAEVAVRCGIRSVTACSSLMEGLESARRDASGEGGGGVVVACGSLFLVGEILEQRENMAEGFTSGSW